MQRKNLDGTITVWADAVRKVVNLWKCCRNIDRRFPVVWDDTTLAECLEDKLSGSRNNGDVSNDPSSLGTLDDLLLGGSNQQWWKACEGVLFTFL